MKVWFEMYLPSRGNARGKSIAHAKTTRRQRYGAFVAVGAAVDPVPPLPVVVTITRVSPRELDDDNLSAACKAVRDGVADALGLASDRDPRVTWRYAQRREAKVTRVEIELEARC